jgi:hypothetical protein
LIKAWLGSVFWTLAFCALAGINATITFIIGEAQALAMPVSLSLWSSLARFASTIAIGGYKSTDFSRLAKAIIGVMNATCCSFWITDINRARNAIITEIVCRDTYATSTIHITGFNCASYFIISTIILVHAAVDLLVAAVKRTADPIITFRRCASLAAKFRVTRFKAVAPLAIITS